MIVSSDDLIDWIADRERLLVAASTPQIAATLAWNLPYAETLAGELCCAMLMTMQRKGAERDFLRLIASQNTGIDYTAEQSLAERFFIVTLTLSRAASRHKREKRSRRALPFKRGVVVGDVRTDRRHLPLSDVLLPWDHAFWLRWHPPFGMDCRCGTISMTSSQLARSGRSITTEDDLILIEAQLHDAWPAEFLPLLDFRRA